MHTFGGLSPANLLQNIFSQLQSKYKLTSSILQNKINQGPVTQSEQFPCV